MFNRISAFAGPISPFQKVDVVRRGLKVYLDTGIPGSYGGSGTTWTDLSGNGKNGTLVNSPTYTSTNNGILTFASASLQYATFPDLGSLSRWTIDTWVKFNSTPAAGTTAVVTNQYNGASSLNFIIGAGEPSSSVIRAGFFDGTWRNTTTGLTPTLGSWYHLVGTYDGSTVILYSNNTSVGTLSYSGTPTSGGGSRIARRWDNFGTDPTDFMDCVVPEVKIYDRALTTTEINQNFNAHRSRYGV